MNVRAQTVQKAILAGLCVAALAGAITLAAGVPESVSARFGPVASMPPLPPLAAAPQPAAAATIVKTPVKSALPLADVARQPRPVSGEAKVAMPVRSPADSPPLADIYMPQRSTPQLPAGPLAWAPSQDPAGLPERLLAARPDSARARMSTDPTLDASLARLLTAAPQARKTPAPFVRLSIPDPFENLTPLELRQPPPDTDPPAPAPSLAKRPTLP